jgi:hypothetical protein
VHADQHAVAAQSDVALEGVRAFLDGLPVRRERVLGDRTGGPAVGHHLQLTQRRGESWHHHDPMVDFGSRPSGDGTEAGR